MEVVFILSKICKTCGQEFQADKAKRVYCSKSCAVKDPIKTDGTLKPRTGGRPSQNIFKSCEFCGTEFKGIKSRITTARFCSQSCRNKWMSKIRKETQFSENNPNFKDGDGGSKYYIKGARNIYENKCNKCGSTENLEVHHIDGNHFNNPLDGSNWEILCRSCHKTHHKLVPLSGIYPRRKYTNTCNTCNSIFHPHTKNQKFCSIQCVRKGS